MSLENEAGTTPDTESSIRDTYADSLGVALAESTDDKATDNVADVATGNKAAPSVDTETAEQKADRLRDEKGRFAAGDGKDTLKDGKAPVIAAAPVVVAPKIQRPSSWKKDHWESFDKLAAENPALANYIHQRESEFATGVSTYKAEFERLRPLEEAVSPFLPILQQAGRDPGEWIQTLGNVHKTFAFGQPHEKLNALLKLAHEYNVPLSEHIARGGQLPQFNPQAPQQQAPVVQQQPQNIEAIVDAKLQMLEMTQQISQFQAARDAQGNPAHPHYETVKQDMIGLLQAGLATDLESAYDRAIRMHDDLWQQQQEAKAQANAADIAAQAKAKVERAKAKVVSVTNSTRSANMSSGGDTNLRDTYANALGAADGRV